MFTGALQSDESALSYSFHISAPVEGQGDMIGVLDLGIRNTKRELVRETDN